MGDGERIPRIPAPSARHPVGPCVTLSAAMRILAIAFGEKRIGLATSDATGTLATPRKPLRRSGDALAVAEILDFCREEEIGLLLVGLPRSPEGVESAVGGRIRAFAGKLASPPSP